VGNHAGRVNRIATEGLVLHHYMLKSLEEFRAKQRRGSVSDASDNSYRRLTDDYFFAREQATNMVEDRSLCDMAPRIRAKIRAVLHPDHRGNGDSIDQTTESMTAEDARQAYREFLEREPESEEMVQAALSHGSIEAMRAAFLRSPEYQGKFIAKTASVLPTMLGSELQLLRSFLCCSEQYLEFGAGRSTVLASKLVRQSIVTIDSSRDWLQKVADDCSAQRTNVKIELIYVDIGTVRDWGFPVNVDARGRWPDYHTYVWSRPGSTDADTYLVDGRFRVACCLQVLLRCPARAVLLVHDFAPRLEYHVIREFAHEIACADSLSAFQRRPDFDPQRATNCLDQYRYKPA
jgi:hypothetical protein